MAAPLPSRQYREELGYQQPGMTGRYNQATARTTRNWVDTQTSEELYDPALEEEEEQEDYTLRDYGTRQNMFSAPARTPSVSRTAAYNRQTQVMAPPAFRQRPSILPSLGNAQRPLIYAGAAAVLLFALFWIVSGVVSWSSVKLDDMRYGRPRTFQTDAVVGHSDSAGTPSHFIAMNLNRRVTIVEIPGGDATKMRTIQGPYLFGKGEDLTPIKLTLRDVNNDGKPDLIVDVKSEQLIYINENDSFRLITADEKMRLLQAK